LRAYAWPGNIRELRNAIERAASMATGDAIAGEDLPEAVRNAPSAAAPPSANPSAVPADLEDLATYRRAMEREYLNRLLALHAGNISHAAQHAGLSRKALYRMLKDAALPPESFR
jgi:DNA-binding NtrC family response regulator